MSDREVQVPRRPEDVAKALRPYSTVRALLLEVIPGLREARPGMHGKSKPNGGGFMALSVDVLMRSRSPAGFTFVRVALAHNYVQEGDVMADPDMEVSISVDDEWPTAEALTFQQSNPPVYQEVYPKPGKVDPALKRSLNSFLLAWARNLKAQGHVVTLR